MHVFVYEWVTGGGWLRLGGPLAAPLLTEGMAMATAVAADLAAIPSTRVTLLRDLRVPQLSAPGADLIEVDSPADHHARFEQLCREADAVVLIAPETDGVLLRAARDAERLGAKLLSPAAEFVALAGDKQHTAEALRDAGVPTPEGLVLEPEDPLPDRFHYPAVLKPVDGAGSQDTHVVAGPHDSPPAYAWPRRLETYVVGAPVSVLVLCGPAGVVALPACRQRLSADGRLRYAGGEWPIPRGLAGRARELAVAAVRALPPCSGCVGVDLVLGPEPGAAADRVVEVNPRLTTSYTGLRFVTESNLAQAMLDVAAGRPVELTFADRAIEFGADGVVSYIEG